MEHPFGKHVTIQGSLPQAAVSLFLWWKVLLPTAAEPSTTKTVCELP